MQKLTKSENSRPRRAHSSATRQSNSATERFRRSSKGLCTLIEDGLLPPAMPIRRMRVSPQARAANRGSLPFKIARLSNNPHFAILPIRKENSARAPDPHRCGLECLRHGILQFKQGDAPPARLRRREIRCMRRAILRFSNASGKGG